MTLTVITPPDALPVSDAELKSHLRIGHDGEDALVSKLNASATKHVEAALGHVLVERTLERRLRGWPPALSGRGALLLPRPVIALENVRIESDGLGPEDVTGRFRLFCDRLVLRPWSIAPSVPLDGAAIIRFRAGYGGAEDVPEDLKLAIMLTAEEAYGSGRDHRGAPELPEHVGRILSNHRGLQL
ncbi:MAG: hypothetical protein AAF753_05770 [Pseudomonadota bacterium]